MRSGLTGSAHTCAAGPAAMTHGSSAFPWFAARPLGFGGVSPPLRIALLALPVAGAALLIAAEFSTLYDVRVVTAVPEGGSFSAGGHHGYALVVMAVGIVVMALGAVLGG